MTVLATLIECEGGLFLGAVALIVLFRLVRGEIDIGQAQLSRLQLLLTTLGFAVYYFWLVVSNPDRAALPDPGVTAMAAFGGSTLLHLSNHLLRLWSAITDPDPAA